MSSRNNKKDVCVAFSCILEKCTRKNDFNADKCTEELQALLDCCAKFGPQRAPCCAGFHELDEQYKKLDQHYNNIEKKQKEAEDSTK